MRRRLFVISSVVAALFGRLPARSMAGKGDLDGFRDVGGPDLKTALEKGLLCRRPVEFEFVDLVVDRVAQDILPVDLVYSTFIWARRKRPYPFVYFRRALRMRAAAREIDFETDPNPDEA
jgi:hypothetical protein